MELRVDHYVPDVERLAELIQLAADRGYLPVPAVNALQVARRVRAYLRDYGVSAPPPTTITDAARAYAAVLWRGGHAL